VLRDTSIILLSSIDWDFNRQNPQEAASAFAGNGSRVLFIENTGARRIAFRDASRILLRLTNWWRARGKPAQKEQGVEVLSPLLVPLPYSRSATALNARFLTRKIRRWVGRGPEGPLIVITFLPTPLALTVIRTLDPALVVYFCVDRLAESSPGARQLEHFEQELLAQADLVLVTAGSLYEMAAPVASHVEIIPSGVRFDAYDRALQSRAGAHPLFDDLTQPVIGFVGSIRDSTDITLIAEVAALAPDLTFVLVGPQMTDVSSLAVLANVRMAGAIPYTEVMNHVVRFDVGILPYVLNSFTAAIMPVKLKEYLAAGLPVVSTRLPEVVAFAEQHPGIIRFASDAPGFVRALRTAIAANTPEAVSRRFAVAREFEWSHQMQRMIRLVDDKLAHPTAELGPARDLADGTARR